MFAVKGWNISAQVKTQVAPPAPPRNDAADAGNPAKSKKRKRAGENDQELNAGGADTSKTSPNVTYEPNTAKQLGGQATKDVDRIKAPENPTQSSSQDNSQAAGEREGDGEVAAGKKKKRRRNKKKGANDTEETEDHKEDDRISSTVAKIAESLPAQPPPAPSNLTPLQSAMRQKLISSRFRYLNETLYTTKSADSAELFRTNPDFFKEYHEGFARQVESWPENPVDGFAALITARGRISSKGYTPGKAKGLDTEAAKLRTAADRLSSSKSAFSLGISEPLPRDPKSRDTTVVDLGCGTGALAKQLQSFKESLRLKLHSFDLASPNELVTVADIRNLPLPEGSVDVAVFSLALMGTNWIEFVEEAWRVLKWKGECWVADVNSRFVGQNKKGRVVEHSVGARSKGAKKGVQAVNEAIKPGNIEDDGLAEEEGARRKESTDVSAFVAVLERRGFALVGEPDVSNRMFARMRFTKSLAPTRGKCSRAKDKRWSMGKKFIEKQNHEDSLSVEEEAKVLKPCVYKTR